MSYIIFMYMYPGKPDIRNVRIRTFLYPFLDPNYSHECPDSHTSNLCLLFERNVRIDPDIFHIRLLNQNVRFCVLKKTDICSVRLNVRMFIYFFSDIRMSVTHKSCTSILNSSSSVNLYMRTSSSLFSIVRHAGIVFASYADSDVHAPYFTIFRLRKQEFRQINSNVAPCLKK